jgi:hypothetical protein
MIPPKIPIIVFSLCRAPPIKFYVTGYVVRGFDPFRLHSSLRSHTVGVSHVAHAYTSEGVMASLAYTSIWPRNTSTERLSTSHIR